MATRLEKIYKTNSVATFNKILEYVENYKRNQKRISEKTRELLEDIETEIVYFYSKNNMDDYANNQKRGK